MLTHCINLVRKPG